MPITVIPSIPRQITVHLGPPNQPAENVTVSFPDYIKNVASSEIYPTWSNAALRANILAQISFALNRVYTAYYPSRGYNFDITSSTATDQKFIKGRSTFENVDRLVDELFNSYIRRQGFVEPLSARFCNGTTVTCEGLSQWGSEELAQQGYDSLQILRRYYGDDIEIVTDAPVRDIPESFPGTLRKGDVGEAVVVVQIMLNRIAQNYPAIPRIQPVDGIFGDRTESSVKKFQEIFNLTADGIVGRATWYKMVLLYVGVTDLSELLSEGQTYSQVKPPASGSSIREGDTGLAVSGLQYFLSVLSQVNTSIPPLSIDGIFGPATRNAVIAFQNSYGLTSSGSVDTDDWIRLYDEYRSVAQTILEEKDLPITPEEIENTLRAGQFPGINLTYTG